MNESFSQSLLEELDARQDEVLGHLEHLNRQIERVIAETLAWSGATQEMSPRSKAA